jgi:hypothetical protein
MVTNKQKNTKLAIITKINNIPIANVITLSSRRLINCLATLPIDCGIDRNHEIADLLIRQLAESACRLINSTILEPLDFDLTLSFLFGHRSASRLNSVRPIDGPIHPLAATRRGRPGRLKTRPQSPSRLDSPKLSRH